MKIFPRPTEIFPRLRKFSHAYENRRNLSTVFTTKLVYMVLNEHYIMIHMKEIAFSTVYEELFAKENARELCTATIVARIFSMFLILKNDLIWFISVIDS